MTDHQSNEPHRQQLRVQGDGDDAIIFIKAVPGASRDQIAGLFGDRLKVRIAAPPEEGKANRAICELLAAKLGIHARDVSIESGHASPGKTVRIRGPNENLHDRLLS